MPDDKTYGLSRRMDPEALKTLMQKALINLGEVVLLDEAGRMVYISQEYAKNMHISIEESLDRRVEDVIEDTCLHRVLHSGKAEQGGTYHRRGEVFFVNRFPIWEDGKVVGLVAQAVLSSVLEDKVQEGVSGFAKELNYYKNKLHQISAPKSTLDTIVGDSLVIRDLKESLHMVARTRSSVLITGKSGTGKEVFAGAIHNLSSRRDNAFIRLNCAAIPDSLLESELFGYEGGAFTGALRGGKIGDFEAANGGTLFLDEVDSLSINYAGQAAAGHPGAGDQEGGQHQAHPHRRALHLCHQQGPPPDGKGRRVPGGFLLPHQRDQPAPPPAEGPPGGYPPLGEQFHREAQPGAGPQRAGGNAGGHGYAGGI